MGSGKGGPQFIPGSSGLIRGQTQQLTNSLNLGQQLMAGYNPRDIINQGANSLNANSANRISAGVGGQSQGVSDLFGLGLDQTAAQIRGDQVPDILANIEGRLRPGLQRSFETGSADIFEQAARAGSTRSSTTVDQLARYRTDLENGLQSTLGGLEGQLQQQNFGQQFAASQGAMKLPQQITDFLRQGGNQQLDQYRFGAGLFTGNGSGNASALGAPTSQNTGASDFISFLGPIMAAMIMGAGGCGVAAATYGPAPEIALVNEWLRTKAPRWLRWCYTKAIPKANPVIAKRAWLRRAVRPAFDWVVRRMIRSTARG